MRPALLLLSLALPLLLGACDTVRPGYVWPVVENTGQAPQAANGADGM